MRNTTRMFGGDNDTIKLQDCILSEYDMGVSNPIQIAANCDCSESYVKQTLKFSQPELRGEPTGPKKIYCTVANRIYLTGYNLYNKTGEDLISNSFSALRI
jgi:hypothetical protein